MKTIHFESYLLGIKPLMNLSPRPHTSRSESERQRKIPLTRLALQNYVFISHIRKNWSFFTNLNYTSWINNVCTFYDSINVIVMQKYQAFLSGTVETTVDRESGVERKRAREGERERRVCVVVHLCKTTWPCRRLPLMPRVLWAGHCWTYDNRDYLRPLPRLLSR